MVLTLAVLECLLRFKLLGGTFEELFYQSVEFSRWPPQDVPRLEHASVQLLLARELEEEYKDREFDRRLARACTRFGGKMDCDFIQACIDQDLRVIDEIFWGKVDAGLEPSTADNIENKTLEPYFNILELRELRYTALENLENYGLIME